MSEDETPIDPLSTSSARRPNAGRPARDNLTTLGLRTGGLLGTGALELGRQTLTRPLGLAGAATGVEAPERLVDETTETLQARHESAYETATAAYEQADTALVIRAAEGLTYAHLASHGLTVEEYREEFGDSVPL